MGEKGSAIIISTLASFILAVSLVGGVQTEDQSGELYAARSGRARRLSSSDPNWREGNADWREIAPGQTITLADVKGPGVIRHVWLTINSQDPQYPRSLVLRMYWEGSDVPAVESPLGDFFAVGHGLQRDVDSQLVAVSSEGRAYNCYWPMPFLQRARITVTNDSPKHKVPKFYYYIDYEEVDRLPEDVRRFHAQYRQAWPATGGDYLVCETSGAGHYVGTVLSVLIRSEGWFGEGDDRFYIDDDGSQPGLHGTGSEDYFCDGWGFREFMRPYYGVVLMEGFDFGDRLSVYRWHTRDPLSFRKSFRFTMEHKGTAVNEKGKHVGGHAERPDYWSTVAFWYQSGRATRFAQVPPLADRLVPATVIEMEKAMKDIVVEPGTAQITRQAGNTHSGTAQVLVIPDSDGTTLRVPFEVETDITGVGRLVLTTSISAGIWTGVLDGREIPKLKYADLYGLQYRPVDFNLGYVELRKGRHELKLICRGKRAESRARQIGIDALRIEHVTRYSVPAGEKD